MSDIYMIGVNHRDPNGQRKLEKLLENLSPEYILLEGSQVLYEEEIAYLDAVQKEIKRTRLDPELASVLLDELAPAGFETRASRSYCSNNGLSSPRYFNDVPDQRTQEAITRKAEKTIQDIRDYHDPKSAREALQQFRNSVESVYALAVNAIRIGGEQSLFLLLSDHHIGYKDAIMEIALRELIAEQPQKRIATITGLKHIIVDPLQRTFYARLKDLNPQRMILYDSTS